jgi:hypothetical protein
MEVVLKLIYNSATTVLPVSSPASDVKIFSMSGGQGSGLPRSIRGSFFKKIIVDLSGLCKPEEFRSQEGYLQ